MERKTTQRIIGSLVVTALIIISLPLLFGGSSSETTAQTAEAKSPPFPSTDVQPNATGVASSTQANDPNSVTISPSLANSINGADPANQTIEKVPADKPVAQTTIPALPETQPATSTAAETQQHASAADQQSATPKADPVVSNNTTAAPAAKLEEGQLPTATEEAPAKPKKVSLKKEKHNNLAMQHHDITKLKGAAWAVQLGSFKNKSNAIRLANDLRAKGYKAFTQMRGNSMRVYVGPEFKQALASSLANKIQEKMNMQGIIVPYQPLDI